MIIKKNSQRLKVRKPEINNVDQVVVETSSTQELAEIVPEETPVVQEQVQPAIEEPEIDTGLHIFLLLYRLIDPHHAVALLPLQGGVARGEIDKLKLHPGTVCGFQPVRFGINFR